ncbi:HAD family hydrolase [Nocardiopsis sp. ARC36]
MIRAVLFDVDDTLVRFSEAMALGLTAHLRDVSPGAASGDLLAAAALWKELADIHYPRFLSGELTFQEQRRARAAEFCERSGLPLGGSAAEQDAWLRAYLHHCEAAFSLYPDVVPVLDGLSEAGTFLGVVSNSTHDYQDRKLTSLGIRDRFTALVCCDDVGGAAKPDPRIFTAATDALGVAPSETAYIGDRWETDALAAARAGLHGVWLDRGVGERRPGPYPPGVSVIRGLDGATDLLAGATT